MRTGIAIFFFDKVKFLKHPNAHTLLLLLPGTTEKLSDATFHLLKRITLTFGDGWWDFLMIGVSFWAYDQHSIDARVCYPEHPDIPCKDEGHFAAKIDNIMRESFGLKRNLSYVFTDSWSQAAGPPGFNTEDHLQQEHWQEETGILWNSTTTRDKAFFFKTRNKVLGKFNPGQLR